MRICKPMILIAALIAIAELAAGQQQAATPREVKIGLLLADLIDVRDAEQAFSADVFVLASWPDQELAGGDRTRSVGLDEIWHPTVLIFNRRSVSETMPQEALVQPDGSVTYLQRYTGTFSSSLMLREFPRDRQELFIRLVSPVRARMTVELVPDESVATLGAGDLSISDWNVREPAVRVEEFQAAPGAPVSPGLKLTIPAVRSWKY